MLGYSSYICAHPKIEEDIRWLSESYLIRTYECDNKFMPGEEASIQCYEWAEFDYLRAVHVNLNKYDPRSLPGIYSRSPSQVLYSDEAL